MRALRKNKLFRRIEADIKERDRKRKPGRPEEYIDHDRKIAVAIGESDIRESMIRHHRVHGGPAIDFEDEANIKVLVQQAEHELNRSQFERALAYLDRAVRVLPDDAEALLLRSACLVGVQQFHEALNDIDFVLTVAACPKAFLVKGDALYHLGDFEHALVHYHRALNSGHCTAKEDELIRFGIGRAEKAVDNALGDRAEGHFAAMHDVMDSIPDDVFDLPWSALIYRSSSRHEKTKKKGAAVEFRMKAATREKNGAKSENAERPKKAPAPQRPKLQRSKSRRRLMQDFQELQSRRERKYQRELLGKLSADLDYLEVLASEVRLAGAALDTVRGNGGVDEVSREADAAINFLRDRQDFWSQFRPMYVAGRK